MRRAFLAVLPFLLLPFAAAAQTVRVAQFGTVQVRCGICHLDRLPPTGGEGTVNFASLKAEGAGEEGICYSCHNGLVRDSRAALWRGFQHPTGVRPRDAEGVRRAGFPLDARGRLVCGSCHTPHTKTEGAGFFMRFGRDAGLCGRCHAIRGAGPERGEHILAIPGEKVPSRLLAAGGVLAPDRTLTCGTCHRIHGSSAPYLLVLSPWGKEGLCQGCHGETIRPGKPDAGASHPVNVRLADTSRLGWSRDSLGLSPSGLVDCWSCHRAHRGAAGTPLLVRELERGNGCGRCHESQTSTVGGRGNHPVRAAGPDTADADRVTCATCHRAHGAKTGDRFLLTHDRGDPALCRGCHAGLFAAPSHPLGTIEVTPAVGRLRSQGAALDDAGNLACATCHRVHGALRDTHGLVMEEWRLCLYCHPGQNPFSGQSLRATGMHPVMVPPGKELGDELRAGGRRLGPGGEVVCATCHRIHPRAGEVPERISCLRCHPDRGGMAAGKHAAAAALTLAAESPAGGAEPEPCRLCHGEHGWRQRPAEGPGDPASRLCLSCHGPSGSAGAVRPLDPSHPVGGSLVAKRALASGLPLYLPDGRPFPKGRVGCLTCHDIHADDADPPPALLRPIPGGTPALCSRCHRDKETLLGTKHDLGTTMPDERNARGGTVAGQGVCSACHLAHGGTGGRLWARSLDGEGDVVSQECRSCHSPLMMPESLVTGPYSHPVTPPPSRGNLPAAEGAAAATPVSCVTCHDAHRWSPAAAADRGGPEIEGTPATSFLRWPDDDASSLCRRCHADRFAVAGTVHDPRNLAARGLATPLPGSVSLCGTCHLVHHGKGPGGWPTTVREKDGAAGTCRQCHAPGTVAGGGRREGGGHPLGVAPGTVAGELPLYDATGRPAKNGEMSCPTCHDLHRGNSPLGGGGRFLRVAAGGHAPLCVGCHPAEALVAGTDHDLRVTLPGTGAPDGRPIAETGICGACHDVHDQSGNFFLLNRPPGLGPDARTRLCTSCHADGGLARLPERPAAHFKGQEGTSFPALPRSFVKREIRGGNANDLPLFSVEGDVTNRGYIACPTCHDAHRWDPAQESPGSGAPEEGTTGDSFLRLKGTFPLQGTFCAECHLKESVSRFQLFHRPGAAGPAAPSGR